MAREGDSEHTDRGFFASAGPAIAGRGQIADVEMLDEPKEKHMTDDIIGGLLQTQQRSCVS